MGVSGGERYLPLNIIEDKANGPAVIEVLTKKIPGIIPVEPIGDKVERAEAITYILESGNAYLPHPQEQSWVQGFIDECSSFPRGKYDDQVDAMTQGLNRLGNTVSVVERLKALVG